MLKNFILCAVFMFITIVIVPSCITFLYGREDIALPDELSKSFSDGEAIHVLNPQTEEIEAADFERYIIGVVAAEMPALFPEEALKAQAVAARTYAVKKMGYGQNTFNAADVYDIGQAYITVDEMRMKWGSHFDQYYAKIENAVLKTQDEIIVYEEEPIEAVFHSTSAGITESAENVWQVPLPYLKSVESHYDEKAPDFIYEKTIPEKEAFALMQNKYEDLIFTGARFTEQAQIIARTPAGYVSTIQVGNKILTGREVRETLGLRSSNFTIKGEGGNIVFTTKGYGHGAGMSQYGANFMAQDGYTYDEILKHYYDGIKIIKNNGLKSE